jgi:diazepam-binding inhibitor (GABA receptor modulating acyl-CoA-binding protein)
MNSKQFLTATETVNSLLKKPSHSELSELYGLYKQAILGDNTNAEPSMLNFKEHAKWKAWSQNKSINKYNAEVKYITLVNELIEKYGLL